MKSSQWYLQPIWAGCLVGMCLTSSVYADDMSSPLELKVFAVHNGKAQSLIPVIEPLLPEGSVVTGTGDQLIVKTTSEGLRDVENLLKDLDRPAQMLVVSVRRVNNAQYDTAINEDGDVDTVGTQPAKNNDDEQRITVQNGHSAFVKTGESIPVDNDQYTLFWNNSETWYKKIVRGFYVKPKLSGNYVTLYINWKYNKLQDQRTYQLRDQSAIDVEEADSTLTIPLNRWVNLSNTSNQSIQTDTQDSYGTQDVENPDKNVLIKVEILTQREMKNVKTYNGYPLNPLENNTMN